MKQKFKTPYWIKELIWVKAFFSPFKKPKIKFYFGDIAIGVPYFYPRKIINNKFVPIKWFGFNYCNLGWKTKWSSTDYRFEYSPVFSFVFMKKQFCIFVIAPEPSNYWESWLYYELSTDKSKKREERIQDCINEFSQTYTVSSSNKESYKKDYYPLILKPKYYEKN